MMRLSAKGRAGRVPTKAILLLATLAVIVAACANVQDETSEPADTAGETSEPDDTENEPSEPGDTPDEMVDAELVVGWFAGMNTGGYFACIQQGFCEDAGINLNVLTGMGASPVPMVAAGRAQFGIGDADEILQARSEGIPIVGLFPTFQETPRIILFHESNPADSFQDFDGRTIYGPAARAWWTFIKSQEGIETEEREYSTAAFLEDDNALIQAYLGDVEAIFSVEAPDTPLGSLPVGPTGWNPYSSMVFTSESFLEEQPDVVRRFVEALYESWIFYRDDPETVNEFMDETDDSDTTVENMNIQADARRQIMYGDSGEDIGMMTLDRWQATLDALIEVGEIEEDVAEWLDASEAFVNEFHPMQ